MNKVRKQLVNITVKPIIYQVRLKKMAKNNITDIFDTGGNLTQLLKLP